MTTPLLREVSPSRVEESGEIRRWFSSLEMDLIVWCDPADRPVAFELCYDRKDHERSISWRPGVGFRHLAVDDGEGPGIGPKQTPVLVADGLFDARLVAKRLAKTAKEVPAALLDFVFAKLAAWPNEG
jgi:hypothetical protein